MHDHTFAPRKRRPVPLPKNDVLRPVPAVKPPNAPGKPTVKLPPGQAAEPATKPKNKQWGFRGGSPND